MRRAPPLLALLVLCSCAPGAVNLERVRGAYSTHFEQIPDQSEICAVVRNQSARPVEWVELRMRSTSNLADAPATWKSSWVYRGHLEPGQRVALRFENPPMADEIELDVVRVGNGPRVPRNARPLHIVGECSEEALRSALLSELEGRAAPEIEIRTATRLTPDAESDALIASPD